MTAALTFSHVSKTYRPGHAPSFREDTVRMLQRLWRSVPARPRIHALSDVSFEIPQGTTFGIMGANGSGKSTALKLASRITYPDSGSIRVRGRVGALLDVGTGLHPELTGRENIWLYGRIHGLRKATIAKKFDSIVEFADIGHALDQPLKQYSSGMQMRLGFGIASHLEPEVLLVDETISVGDAGFQKRCVDYMASLHLSGTTIVFVSHVVSLVPMLCSEGLLLHHGRVQAAGPIDDIVARYLEQVARPDDMPKLEDDSVALGAWDYTFTPGRGRYLGDLDIRLSLLARVSNARPRVVLSLTHPRAGALVMCSMVRDGFSMDEVEGRAEVVCHMRDLSIESGEYAIWLSVVDGATGQHLLGPRQLGRVVLSGSDPSRLLTWTTTRTADPLVRTDHSWEITAQRRAATDQGHAAVDESHVASAV